MEEACQPSEVNEERSGSKEEVDSDADPKDGPNTSGSPDADVSAGNWEVPLFECSSSGQSAEEELYVYNNRFSLVPRSIRRFGRLKTLKFFANHIDVLPPETGDLVELRSLHVRVSLPGISSIPFQKLSVLKELELCRVPPKPSAFSILSDITRLKCLTKLSICHFSIRYLPPEIGCLKKLEELDLSFNKLRNLPEDISELSALRLLRVANNKLVALPSGLSYLSRLENLDLSNNRLTSLSSLKLASMHALQYLSLQYNKILSGCPIPSWICCNLEGNGKDTANGDIISSLVEVDVFDVAIQRDSDSSCDGCQCSSSTQLSEATYTNRCHATQRMRRGWKCHDTLQQRARQERLNYSRKCRGEHNLSMNVKMFGNKNPCKQPIVEDGNSELQCVANDDTKSHCSTELNCLTEKLHGAVEDLNVSALGITRDTGFLISSKCSGDNKNGLKENLNGSDHSCISTERSIVDGDDDYEHEVNSSCPLVSQPIDSNGEPSSAESYSLISAECSDVIKDSLRENGDGFDCSNNTFEPTALDENHDCKREMDGSSPPLCQLHDYNTQDVDSSSESSKLPLKVKRHSDKDLYNPKSKCRRPVGDCLNLSWKYSTESFCSSDDHLPDGFYDAGRGRPFTSLQNYEQSLCLDSREVILLDRQRDEELDAIALSAQIMLSKLKKSTNSTEGSQCSLDDLQRASMLALFVSDCFGGSDRSCTIIRMRKAVVGLTRQQPFVCTCSAGNNHDKNETPKRMYSSAVDNFQEMCEKSLRFIKETRNSNVVPIGILRFGVCRHRAVLMKYLCDRAHPSIPCELVRGYLDFMPHAWNAILVRKGSSWVRMVVDACHPTDIREETDPEYFCRYIPMNRVHIPLSSKNSTISGYSFPSLSLFPGTEKGSSGSVRRCKFGSHVAAAKVRCLNSDEVSEEAIKIFEYTFLGEVRMLGALRKHKCIVEIFGHQLSSKWDGNKARRILQSTIVMEYIKGGSLKHYLAKLSRAGKKHVPVNIALYIARDIAYALVEVHSKHIIHRDIKSENILVDLDRKRVDSTPVVKLSDFDRAVPLWSFLHTCCIAHLGIHPPDVCVGTPRWMAPEVLQAMHRRALYGLEVDIWSYGCLLLELLTLQIPYEGLAEAEIHYLLQTKQRPMLTPELEELALSEEPAKMRLKLGLSSDAEVETLKLLVDLFYHCTSGNPVDRPTARHIYDMLCGDAAN